MGGPHPSVVTLAGVDSLPPEMVGGKARGFAVIARAGLPAPDGFVVTAAVHRTALMDSGLVPGDAVEEIVRLVEGIGDAPLAVRSSALAEDGLENSYAGQFLTRLGVRGPDAVLEALRECWASAEGYATAYRAMRGDETTPEMAVIVQRLAAGEAAGVCMSCDPLTGDPETLVVNAAYGLGEMVVSGLVTPDDYRIARSDGRLVRFDPGDHEIMLVHEDDGLREVPVPDHLRGTRVLDDAVLDEIRDGLLRCEAALGRRADCEFSIVDGRVVWLQCRPMTALGYP